MIRSALCLVALFGVGSVAGAGELDKEVKVPKAGIAAGPVKLSGSELDAESPTDAWYHRGYWGHHHHHHHYGYAGYRGYYGGFGGYRGYGYVYSPYVYRPAFYAPYYGGYYGGFTGGFGYGFRAGYVGFGYAGW